MEWMKWTEILFTFAYLTTIWTLVTIMTVKMPELTKGSAHIASLFRTAFLFLIIGDSGLLISRLIAFFMGGLEYSPAFLGGDVHLAGLGNLSTGITMTFFYLFVLEAWRRRYNKPVTWMYTAIIATAFLRFIFMSMPQNNWGSHVPPVDWSIYRNLFVTVIGLGVAMLILTDAKKSGDKPFIWIAYMIFVSYFCMWIFVVSYPAIPWIGVVMVVKTLAYMVVGFIAYFEFYVKKDAIGT